MNRAKWGVLLVSLWAGPVLAQSSPGQVNGVRGAAALTPLRVGDLVTIVLDDEVRSDVAGPFRGHDAAEGLTVRVTATEPDGTARIAGSRFLLLDGRKRELTLQAVIRMQDVSASQTVVAWRVADPVIGGLEALTRRERDLVDRIFAGLGR